MQKEKIKTQNKNTFKTTLNYYINSTQPEITDAGVWHLYVRIINNITIL